MRLLLVTVGLAGLVAWIATSRAEDLGSGSQTRAVSKRDSAQRFSPAQYSKADSKPSTEPVAVVTVDNSTRYQQIDGFGATHLALASSDQKDDLTPKLRAQAIDLVYGQVHLTLGNVEIGPIETPANARDPWKEQANDDGDPLHFNWPGFNFSGSDVAKQKLIDLAQPLGFDGYYPGLRASVRWANTWMKPIRANDYNRYLDEVAEQMAAGMIHWRDSYGIVPKYVQLFNEPTTGNQELDPGSSR